MTAIILVLGLNPIWKESFNFIIEKPEVAFLRFQVFNSDSVTNELIASYCVAMFSLEQGKMIRIGELHCSAEFKHQRAREVGLVTIA